MDNNLVSIATLVVATVTGIAATINSAALIYDVVRRYRIRSVSWVKVRNENLGGVREFKTRPDGQSNPPNAKSILIAPDNTVEVVGTEGQKFGFGDYVEYRV